MGRALRDAYGDLFLINEHPSDADRSAIQGKFKSFHNTSENVAGNMSKTFLGLLALAELSGTHVEESNAQAPSSDIDTLPPSHFSTAAVGLHYNIQLHLPATKDVEVYNAIFKSLRAHLIDG